MEYFNIYNLTFLCCFIFWMYFDQMSNTIFNLKSSKVNDTNAGTIFLQDPKNRYLINHVIIKIIFYISLIFILFKVSVALMIFAFIGHIIGTQFFSKTNIIENVVAAEKVNNGYDNKKLVTYINMSYFSAIIFTISLYVF